MYVIRNFLVPFFLFYTVHHTMNCILDVLQEALFPDTYTVSVPEVLSFFALLHSHALTSELLYE